MRPALRCGRGTTSSLPYVKSADGEERPNRYRDTAPIVDIALREGDVGWVLVPEALDAVISDRHEIIRSFEPEPVDLRLAFDISWAMYRYAAYDIGGAATAQIKVGLSETAGRNGRVSR